MSIASSILYAYETPFIDVKELLLTKITNISYSDTKVVCRYFRQKMKTNRDKSYTYLNMLEDIDKIYNLFRDKWNDISITYLVKKDYINGHNYMTNDRVLECIRYIVRDAKFMNSNEPQLNSELAKKVLAKIPIEFRNVDFYKKFVDENILHFCAISPKFKGYSELCLKLLKDRKNIFLIIPKKWRTTEMFKLFIELTDTPIDITTHRNVATMDTIISLFNSGRLLSSSNTISKYIFEHLFNIDKERSLNYYNPEIHGIEYISLYLTNNIYDVLDQNSKYVTFNMIKDLPNLYELYDKYIVIYYSGNIKTRERYDNYINLLLKNYRDFVKKDIRFVDMYFKFIHYDDPYCSVYKDNHDMIFLTLDYDIGYLGRLYNCIDYDTIIRLINIGKFNIDDIRYFNDKRDIQKKLCLYLLNMDIKYYGSIYHWCKEDVLTDELVCKILETNIYLYVKIPNIFKNMENSKKYLDAPNSKSYNVPCDILEIIDGKSAYKFS